MTQHGLERIAVVEEGRLLGVLAREPVVRRLAEDEPPPAPEAIEEPLAAGVGAGWRRPLGRGGKFGGRKRGTVQEVLLADLELGEPEVSERLGDDQSPGDDDGSAVGMHTANLSGSETGSDASWSTSASIQAAARRWPWTSAGSSSSSPRERTASVVTVPATPTACVGRGSSGSTARTCSRHAVSSASVGVVRAKEALGQANAAEVEAPVPVAEDELGRAAADVDDQRSRRKRAPGGDPGVGESRLLISGQEAGVEAVAPFDLAEERLAVLRVPDGARRDGERPLDPGRLEHAPVVGQRVPNARECGGEEEATLVHALAQAGDRQPAVELAHGPALHLGHEQPRRVRPQVDDPDAGHLLR